jgi:biopolymer transport protein ExbB
LRRSVAFMTILLVFSLLPVTTGARQPPTGDQRLRASPGQTVADNRPLPDRSAAADSEHNLPNLGARNPLQVIFSGGITGILIILLLVAISIIAMALTVEHLLTLRRSVLIPDRLEQQVHGHLAQGDLAAADRACQAQPSTLAAVLRSGFQETAAGWPAMEKRMEQALAEQAARLMRKIDYLSVIGNIAPMIGLLGTVVGMIFAFQEVADTQGAARAAELASGIYQALVTTVGGLIVAIPSLTVFAIFRNRVDGLIAETASAAEQAVAPVKRALQGRSSGGQKAATGPAQSGDG